MLTQDQVDLACRLLRRLEKRRSQKNWLDREIAYKVGCSETTIYRLRHGIRHKRGKLMYRVNSMPTKIICPRCGPIKGSYCVFCATLKGMQKKTLEAKEANVLAPTDPTPSEIAVRAAEIRSKRAEKDRAKSLEALVDWLDPVFCAY